MLSTHYYQILMKLEFLDRFSKNREVQNCMQIRPEGAELFQGDERKDRKT